MCTTMDKDYIWSKVLTHMEKCYSNVYVPAFFDDVEVIELTENKLVLCTPYEFCKDVIVSRYTPYIKKSMKELFEMDVEIQVLSENELDSPKGIRLNPQFVFSQFIVGPSNQFAYAASHAVANKYTDTYNPLYIYGPSGLGKTHLLHAIAAEISQHHPEYNVIYINGDQFTNELLQAEQEGHITEFANKYGGADVLLVDDIQSFSNKEAIQEEYFRTFNNLYKNHKLIVLASDRPPSELLRLEERLKTLFEWGLVADINPPDYETRIDYIRYKSKALSLAMPDEVCSYIADILTANISQLENTLKKLRAFSELCGMEIDVPNVAQAIKSIFEKEILPTPNLIISEVCRYYNITEDAIRNFKKKGINIEARQVAMYLIKKMTNLSLPDICSVFNRDQRSVHHSIRKIETALENSENPIKETIEAIMQNINNRMNGTSHRRMTKQ